jgi:CRISPR-associated protein Cas1
MLKRTLFFSKRGHLRVELAQLKYEMELDGSKQVHSFPLEDVGFVVVESTQITLTAYALQALAKNNTSVTFCDQKHMPAAVLLPHASHTLTQRNVEAQLSATDAAKDRFWRQTVISKIDNQAACLKAGAKSGAERLRTYLPKVKNGDPGNCEALAAREYFGFHFKGNFRRSRDGGMPNPALNYGYAILRAATARALVGSGLLCLVGIHHHNQYNAFALADDIMEPYRPFVDDIVLNQPNVFPLDAPELTRDMKAALLSVLAVDAMVGGIKRPLMNALSCTTASLVRCFRKEEKEIAYPSFPKPCPPTPP